MENKDCFLIGTIFKLHGYKGKIKLYNENRIIIDFCSLKYIFIKIDNQLIPFFIEKITNINKNVLLIKLDDVNSDTDALKILKREVYISNKFCRKQPDESDEIINFKVIDNILGVLGFIEYINKQSKQELIYVNNGESGFWVPKDKKFIKKINKSKRIIEVSIPKDIIDLN
tara:strand:+ start:62 stop:574 length:513 start_codon:yes stop_codon:yes gene_type:complete